MTTARPATDRRTGRATTKRAARPRPRAATEGDTAPSLTPGGIENYAVGEAIAAALGVKPSVFLAEGEDAKRRMLRLLREAERIRRQDPSLDRENIRHVLLLLDEKPINRLRRSLIRAQKSDVRV